jgi:hypothetical protein
LRTNREKFMVKSFILTITYLALFVGSLASNTQHYFFLISLCFLLEFIFEIGKQNFKILTKKTID